MTDNEARQFAIRSNRNMLAVFQELNIPLYARFSPDGAEQRKAGARVKTEISPAGVSEAPTPSSMLSLFDAIRAPKLSDEELARDHADLDRSMDIPDDRDDAGEDTEEIGR